MVELWYLLMEIHMLVGAGKTDGAMDARQRAKTNVSTRGSYIVLVQQL